MDYIVFNLAPGSKKARSHWMPILFQVQTEQSLGLEQWRAAVMKEVFNMKYAWTKQARKKQMRVITLTHVKYEMMEYASLLELCVWKRKIAAVTSSRIGELDRRKKTKVNEKDKGDFQLSGEERWNCLHTSNAQTIVAKVMPYLLRDENLE